MRHELVEDDTFAPVKPGMRLLSYRNEIYELVSFRAPRHAASTGRVIVRHCDTGKEHEFFPSVFNLKIMEIDNERFK